MKTVTLLLLSLLTVSCQAQTTATTPTIKGHMLGESLQQFITEASPATREQIRLCEATNDQNRYAVNGCDSYLWAVAHSSQFGLKMECYDPAVQLGVCREFRGSAKFVDDKLVEVHLQITDKQWAEALSDVTAKFGKPDEVQTETAQNAYGAKFELQSANWTKPNYLLVTNESVNLPYNLKRFVEVNLTDRAYFQKQQSKKPQGNALN